MICPDSPEPVCYSPIGYVRCERSYRSETPRQGVFANNSGRIELFPGHDYETALRDLDEFTHIWVIYDLHLNKKWKPVVSPPVTADRKRFGVFATRSPHRPCSIGMSCVRLERIDKLTLHIKDFDMLDATPVLDLKPYIPDSDSVPAASRGWLPQPEGGYEIRFQPEAEAAMNWIVSQDGPDLKNFCLTQLAVNPLDAKRKRVKLLDADHAVIHCRTWKIKFKIDQPNQLITVRNIESNYLPNELSSGVEDRYNDKELHREFIREIS
jgi:tRNA (adenine37-N6)-methyltransferase